MSIAWVFPLYLLVVLLISWISRQRLTTSNQYLNASSSLPTWAVALSFLAYNCGSIEILGMSAMAAQYGVQALHFYWIGGLPGLVFMALVVIPLFRRAGARSLPEYFEMRFGPDVRFVTACLSLVSTAAFSGVTLFGLADMLHVLAGWSLLAGTGIAAGVVLVYVLAGGVRATIYTSVFQLAVLIGGLAPLLFLSVHFSPATFAHRSAEWHLWKPLPWLAPRAPLDRFGVICGLGFVTSFGYWCTDFVMIQRALAAKSLEGARRVPLLAGFGKALIAFLVVLPAVAASSRLHEGGFNEVLPRLMVSVYAPVYLAFGASALLAGLMAGMAGNVSGFAALWTEEIYRPRICPGRAESHYLRIGKLSILACVLLAVLGAFATLAFHDLMEFLQLILALFYAPVFAVLLFAVIGRRLQSRGAIAGIVGGVVTGLTIQGCFWAGWLRFGSQMNANFYTSCATFLVALGLCWFSSQLGRGEPPRLSAAAELNERTLSFLRPSGTLVLLAVLLLGLCVVLNVFWR